MSGRAMLSPDRVHTALAAADALRAEVRRLVVDGEVYHAPVLDGRPVDLETMRRWADADDPRRAGQPPRRLRLVIIDESTFVPGSALAGWRVDPAGLRLDGPYLRAGQLALTFLDTCLVIGVCEAVALTSPGEVSGTEGRALVAEARIYDTILGTLVWGAIGSGLFNGVCVAIDHLARAADGSIVTPIDLDEGAKMVRAGTAAYVVVGDLASSCCGNARILRAWEEEI